MPAFHRAQGPAITSTEIMATTCRLDTRAEDRTPSRFRVARFDTDLVLAPWRPVTADIMEVSLAIPGTQFAQYVDACAEIEYTDASTIVVDLETYPCPLEPEEGYLVRLLATEHEWRLRHYGEPTSASGNEFYPFEWSDAHGGHWYSTLRTRQQDIGEQPHDILAAMTYSRWCNLLSNEPGPETWDFSCNTTRYRTRLAGLNLDLKGGALYFWLVATEPDGRRGRYHLLRPLAINLDGHFDDPLADLTDRTLPSGSCIDWCISWAAGDLPFTQMPSPGPNWLTQIESCGISIRGYSDLPTGTLLIKEFAIPQ